MSIQSIIARIAADPRLGGFTNREGNTCAYRTEDGHACGIGCLLSDDDLSHLIHLCIDNCPEEISCNEETLDILASVDQLYSLDPGLEAVLGMNRKQATLIQRFHDSFCDDPNDPVEQVRIGFENLASGETIRFFAAGGAPTAISIEILYNLKPQ